MMHSPDHGNDSTHHAMTYVACLATALCFNLMLLANTQSTRGQAMKIAYLIPADQSPATNVSPAVDRLINAAQEVYRRQMAQTAQYLPFETDIDGVTPLVQTIPCTYNTAWILGDNDFIRYERLVIALTDCGNPQTGENWLVLAELGEPAYTGVLMIDGEMPVGLTLPQLPAQADCLSHHVVMDDTDAAITYTGGWFAQTGWAGRAAGTLHESSELGAEILFNFKGIAIDLIAEKQAWGGTADVYIDGALEGTIDFQAASPQFLQNVFSLTGLSDSVHQVRIINTAANQWIYLDAVRYTVSHVMVDDAHPAVTYTGSGWNPRSNILGRIDGTTHETSIDQDAFEFSFKGTAVELISEKQTWGGTADVYIDDILVSTVDFASADPDQLQQVIFSADNLDCDTHTIKLIKTGGGWVYLDAVRYCPCDTIDPDLPPTDLGAVAASSEQINLNWTDNSSSETAFSIERKTTGDFDEIATVATDVTAYTDTGLIMETTYTYRVRALLTTGYTDYSNEAFDTTPGPQPPIAPTLEITEVGGGQIALVWVDNSGGQAQGYLLTRKINDGDYATHAAFASSITDYVDAPLEPENTYCYRIKAYNNIGASDPSNEGCGTTPAAYLPADPADLNATQTRPNQIQLNWTDSSDNETGFIVERQVDGGAFNTLAYTGANIARYTDRNLPEGTYTYRLLAYNNLGQSGYSNEDTVSLSPSAPQPPVLSVDQVAGSQIALSWTAETGNVEGFLIDRKIGEGNYDFFAAFGSLVRDYLDSGLAASTTYTYRIRAYNAYGTSDPSNQAAGTTEGPEIPNAPTNLTAGQMLPNQIRLTWTDNADNEAGFLIERSDAGGPFNGLAVVGPNFTRYTNSNLATGLYIYRVKAFNVAGHSDYSNEAIISIGIPEDPPVTQLTAGDAQIIQTTTPVVVDGNVEATWNDANSYPLDHFVIGTSDTAATWKALWDNDYLYLLVEITDADLYRDGNSGGDLDWWWEDDAIEVFFDADNSKELTFDAVNDLQYGFCWNDTSLFVGQNSVNITTGVAHNVSDASGGFLLELALPWVTLSGGPSQPLQTPSVGKIIGLDVHVDDDDNGGNRESQMAWICPDETAWVNPSLWGEAELVGPVTVDPLVIDQVLGGQIDLSWYDVTTQADGFILQRKVGSGNYAFHASMTSAIDSYQDAGLEPETTYCYRVLTYQGGTITSESNDACATTPAASAVPAPTDLDAVKVRINQIELNWTDNAGNEYGSKIERSDNGGGFAAVATVAANVTNYSDKNLAIGTYTYRVLAYNGIGESDYTNEDTVTLEPTPPDAPVLSIDLITDGQINLGWTIIPGSTDGFLLERKTATGDFVQIAALGSLLRTYQDAGLAPSTDYCYRIRGYNAYGASPYSNEACGTTDIGDVPDAPTELVATQSLANQIRLTWTDNAGNEQGFEIERDAGSGFQTIAIVAANFARYTDRNLAPGTYNYRVRAYNSVGTSDYSNEDEETLP